MIFSFFSTWCNSVIDSADFVMSLIRYCRPRKQCLQRECYQSLKNHFYMFLKTSKFFVPKSLLKRMHVFFISNEFFSTQLQCCLTFNELSLKCCLSVTYHIEALSYGDTLYFVYLSLCLPLGLFNSYLCDLFFYYHFHFYYNERFSLIDTDKPVFWTFLGKVQPQSVA